MLEEIRSARASFALETLEPRYRRLLRGLDYDDKAQDLAGAILRFGQIDRGDACVVLKTSERTARNALSRLVQGGFLKSATPKGPVRIAFPAEHRDQLFPQIFARAAADPPRCSRLRPLRPTPAHRTGVSRSATATPVTKACRPANPRAHDRTLPVGLRQGRSDTFDRFLRARRSRAFLIVVHRGPRPGRPTH